MLRHGRVHAAPTANVCELPSSSSFSRAFLYLLDGKRSDREEEGERERERRNRKLTPRYYLITDLFVYETAYVDATVLQIVERALYRPLHTYPFCAARRVATVKQTINITKRIDEVARLYDVRV